MRVPSHFNWPLPSRAGGFTIGAHYDWKLRSPQKQNARGRERKLSAPAGNKTTTPRLQSVVTILTELIRIQSIIQFKKK